MSLSQTTSQLSQLSPLVWVVLLLVLALLLWFLGNQILNLKQNGHLKVDVLGKEILEVEKESNTPNEDGSKTELEEASKNGKWLTEKENQNQKEA